MFNFIFVTTVYKMIHNKLFVFLNYCVTFVIEKY